MPSDSDELINKKPLPASSEGIFFARPMKLTRRNFLKSASAAIASSWLGMRFKGGAARAAEPGADVAYPLFGLRPWIETYQPPKGNLALQQPQNLKFDWKFWNAHAYTLNPPTVDPLGSLVIERHPASDGIKYHVRQMRDKRTLGAHLTCAADESIQGWTLIESYPYAGAEGNLITQTTGLVENGQARVTRYGREEIVPLDGPLFSSWTLMSNPELVKRLAAAPSTFTLADEMFVLRPAHRIQPDIDTPVPNLATCASYLLTGRGSSPAHLVVSPDGRPIITTLYMTSVVLTSIENAV